MQNLYRLKILGMINRKRPLLCFLFIFMIILSFIIVEKCPKYVEVYKYTLNANVSILNDDLKGALGSYEKAHLLLPSESLKKQIIKMNQLIKSKSNFLRAEQSEQNKEYESAYYYYANVDSIDEKRYQLAQDKLISLEEQVVDETHIHTEEYEPIQS
ncbi:MAG: hypothetical protein IJD87_01025 [Turicibacter sp.]|nr:hypothetical protein [Turicibacter sp.]